MAGKGDQPSDRSHAGQQQNPPGIHPGPPGNTQAGQVPVSLEGRHPQKRHPRQTQMAVSSETRTKGGESTRGTTQLVRTRKTTTEGVGANAQQTTRIKQKQQQQEQKETTKRFINAQSTYFHMTKRKQNNTYGAAKGCWHIYACSR